MSSVADISVMRDMRLLKRNAYKAVDEALIKSKSDGAFSEKEMEELRDEIEALISKFDVCVCEHIKMLNRKGTRTRRWSLGRCIWNCCVINGRNSPI